MVLSDASSKIALRTAHVSCAAEPSEWWSAAFAIAPREAVLNATGALANSRTFNIQMRSINHSREGRLKAPVQGRQEENAGPHNARPAISPPLRNNETGQKSFGNCAELQREPFVRFVSPRSRGRGPDPTFRGFFARLAQRRCGGFFFFFLSPLIVRLPLRSMFRVINQNRGRSLECKRSPKLRHLE